MQIITLGYYNKLFRKHCTNCRCGKADHNVLGDEGGGGGAADGGFYFVGRLFDRPMRSRKEELQFCYGNALEEDISYGPIGILTHSNGRSKQTPNGKKVKFDWIPQNVSDRLARLYLNQIPEATVPIAGSEGAYFRQQVSF